MASQIDSSERWKRQCELFHEALDHEPSERLAFLEGQCASDFAMLQEVEALLAAHDDRPSLLDSVAEMTLDQREDSPDSRLDQETQVPFEKILAPGTLLADRFEIVRLLGRGGMGTVYEARDRELRSSVAVKILRPEISLEASVRERFRREIHLARQVTHPNACRIFDLFRHGQDLLLSMELLEGETLAARLQREGPVTSEQALAIVGQVTEALTEAHRVGVIHRDLKSANVMLVPDGEGVRAVVTDFGLAISKQSSEGGNERITQTGQLLGTPAYMAPEQLEGATATPATDVYALGLLLYEMVTGELPFSGETPISGALQRLLSKAPSARERVPELDGQLDRVILRCLEREPEERYRSPAEVLAALQGETIPAPWTPRRRKRWAIGGAIAAGLALLVLLVGPQWFSPVSPAPARALGFTERDWVLIASFENHTGETIFDGTLEAALSRELSNSRFVNVVPRQRVADTLQLMHRPTDALVDATMAREVVLRDGGIRALLTGQVERLGPTYILSAGLVDPGNGATVASYSEDAEGEQEILPAVRRLASQVREDLGEALPTIRQSEIELAKVTTPSLKALQLFSEADAVIVADNALAERLLLQAIEQDPTFAMAHYFLAAAIRNQWRVERRGERREEEAQRYSQLAFELADTASERERLFLRAEELERRVPVEGAHASYLAWIRLYPDDHWAAGNFWVYLAFGLERFTEAIPYAVRWAELRPNLILANRAAAQALAIWGDRPDEARPFLEQGLRLADEGVVDNSSATSWLRLYPLHQLWAEGDLPSALEAAERLHSQLGSLGDRQRTFLAEGLSDFYLAPGMFETAEEVAGLIPDPGTRRRVVSWIRVIRDGERFDPGSFDPRSFDLGNFNPNYPIYAARVGSLEQARSALTLLEEELSRPPARFGRAVVPLARGAIALAEGHTDQAIQALEEGVESLRPVGFSPYFLGAESLAEAWRTKGDLDKAAEVLEDASRQKQRAMYAREHWMRLQWQLAETYRQMDRMAEAIEVEDGLRELLVYADQDFWLVQALKNLEGVAVGPSAP